MRETLHGHLASIECVECSAKVRNPRTLGGGADPRNHRVAMTCSNDDCFAVVHIYVSPVHFAVWPHLCPHGMPLTTYIDQLRAGAIREASERQAAAD